MHKTHPFVERSKKERNSQKDKERGGVARDERCVCLYVCVCCLCVCVVDVCGPQCGVISRIEDMLENHTHTTRGVEGPLGVEPLSV